MIQLSQYEELSLQKLGESIHKGKWSNEGLVKLIELAGDFLNIKTVPEYAKEKGISDVAARKDTFYRKNRTIFNTKFVIDND
jgi:hypothetical protein